MKTPQPPLRIGWLHQVKQLKQDSYALYLAYKDPRIAWYARWWVALVVAYAFSPIDLIPDFIPLLGYLDDLILVPLGILIAIKLIPKDVLEECRQQAQIDLAEKPVSWVGAVVIVSLWSLLLALLLANWIYH